jgi:hypothetical protein
MKNHRHQVPGPANIQLNAPHTDFSRTFECGEGILFYDPVVVIAAVGDDFTAAELFIRRHRLGETAEQGIGQLKITIHYG